MIVQADFARGQVFVEAVIKAACPDWMKVQSIAFSTRVVGDYDFKFSAELQVKTTQGDLAVIRLQHEEIVTLTQQALIREGYAAFELCFEPELVEQASRSIKVLVKLRFETEARNPVAS